MRTLTDDDYQKLLNLFAHKGITFTTNDVARELGISKRTIYEWFHNKSAIIEKTIDYVFADLQKESMSIAENQCHTADKIKAFFDGVPDMYQVGWLIQHSEALEKHYPELMLYVDRRLDQVWDTLLRIVENQLSPTASIVIRTMLTETMQKLLSPHYLETHQLTYKQGFEAFTEVILYGLIGSKDKRSDERNE
ncbi:TetR/AcrR family transcriptional regulator [Bacillus sp. Marseille-P3800]|uniref:TetR/AcrR family transcriptional regulator n=1 Tax=Bacillus sp. Marseille-P3800 TaxID=2014782 RepID=UPI000C08AD05|nr:TetR/AcrR family transcriptional regulator [Bacillus sp. Marseille-P3800]